MKEKFFVKGDEVIQIPYRSQVQDGVNLEKLTGCQENLTLKVRNFLCTHKDW